MESKGRLNSSSVLHIFSDNLHYLDKFIELNEHFGFVGVYATTSLEINYKNTKTVYLGSYKILEQLVIEKKIKGILIHYLTDEVYSFVKGLRVEFSDIKVGWMIWSADLYLRLNSKQYDVYTNKFFYRNALMPVLSVNLDKYIRNTKKKIEKLELDFISSAMLEDYKISLSLFNKPLPYFRLIYEPFDGFGSVGYPSETVEGIILNHSGDPSMNHLDVLYLLKKLKINMRVLMPLSYGDVEYIKYVKSKAVKIYSNLLILEKHLNSREYWQFLSSYTVVIMGSHIQKGLGNVFALLYQGKKLFLHEDSPVFKELKSWGIKVYKINEINSVNVSVSKSEAIELKEFNTRVLNKFLTIKEVENDYSRINEYFLQNS